MQFHGDPLIGAAKHLNGASHGGLPRTHDLAVQMLGTKVLNCNQALADQNNALARRKTAGETKARVDVYANRGRKSTAAVWPGQREHKRRVAAAEAHRRRSEHLARTRDGPAHDEIINPKPGTLYTVYWKNSSAYYPVMILPWGRFRRLGWKETLAQTGLLHHVPAC
ncbi:hypothetical protein NW767_015327 [Fusarium falciforme]|nr:hypothetical protein NW767_015327 [Fusarium falciforme]